MNLEKLKKDKNQQNKLFERSSLILSSLASPVRLKIIHFLSQSSMSVETLSQKIDQSTANTSMHLRKMFHESIVSVKTQGQKRIYELDSAFLPFWESCQDFVIAVDPSLDLTDRPKYKDMNWQKDVNETKRLVSQGEVFLLDVRPLDEVKEKLTLDKLEFCNIPAFDLEKNLKKIPKDKIILVLCRGRACALSLSAVTLLRENNLKAYRLNDSWYATLKKYQKGESK